MLGRERELAVLEKAWEKNTFQFMVMYGRRRVGKTTILQAFSERHESVFFPAQEKNDSLNLQDFSAVLQRRTMGESVAPFSDWEKALSFAGKQATPERRILLVIDEFPFLAAANPSIKSILQHAIDHDWKDRNIFLVLCGSSVSFMLNEVMGYKSPLYGRITGQMEVRPFDYLDAAAFFPNYTREEQLLAYGILGGIPRYLAAFDGSRPIEENLREEILPESTFLHDEPQMLLRSELREPSVYNSILEAIANGANKLTEISDRIHEDRSKCGKYLQTLQAIRLVRKAVPCGEPETSRKGVYELADFYCSFWYRFVFSRAGFNALLGPEAAAKEVMKELSTYMGPRFERICLEFLLRKARLGALPFVPASIGRWWGVNPAIRAQDDVDILAIDRTGTRGIFCECKYRNHPMPMEEYDDLVRATAAFPNITERHLVFFSKSGFTRPVAERAAREGARLLTVGDLFQGFGEAPVSEADSQSHRTGRS